MPLDVYLDVDVCHPSAPIPAALASAEARNATGRAFFETVVAALALLCRMASVLPLHGNRLHHVGHAAWVVPLVAYRLGLGPEGGAHALNLACRGLVFPEGLSRGQIANFDALAYPTQARQAIDLTELSEAGLRGHADGCEEGLALFAATTGFKVTPQALVGSGNELVPGIGVIQRIENEPDIRALVAAMRHASGRGVDADA